MCGRAGPPSPALRSLAYVAMHAYPLSRAPRPCFAGQAHHAGMWSGEALGEARALAGKACAAITQEAQTVCPYSTAPGARTRIWIWIWICCAREGMGRAFAL